MDIRKDAVTMEGGLPNPVQLSAINKMAKSEMKAEQVYVFAVRLCDDQTDRDHERFDTAALPELAKMFIGKCGIADHNWSAKEQVARVFATEVVKDGDVSYLKAWAYIRRGGKGDEWIADIEAGIKKEVSIGCSMGRSICSICGGEYGSCGHQKGEYYDGRLCCAILKEPMDAYEFSFVAVPAQPEAGVLKAMGKKRVSLKELADEFGAQEEYRGLFKLAQLGRQYTSILEDEVVRLCFALELGMEEQTLRSMVKKLAPEELTKFKSALEQRMAESYPMQSQLMVCRDMETLDSEYMI